MLIAGCATTGARVNRQPFHIASVEVVNALPAPTHVPLEPAIQQAVAENLAPHPVHGAPKTMRLTLTDLHYKHAGRAILLGDTHRLTGYATIFDQASGREEGSATVVGIDDQWMQGVAGALQAALADKAKLEADLAKSFGKSAVRVAYRSEYKPTAVVMAEEVHSGARPVASPPAQVQTSPAATASAATSSGTTPAIPASASPASPAPATAAPATRAAP